MFGTSMASLLERKYAIQEQQARATTRNAETAAREQATRAGMTPTAIALDQARTAREQALTALIPGDSAAARAEMAARTSNLMASTLRSNVDSASLAALDTPSDMLAQTLLGLGMAADITPEQFGTLSGMLPTAASPGSSFGGLLSQFNQQTAAPIGAAAGNTAMGSRRVAAPTVTGDVAQTPGMRGSGMSASKRELTKLGLF